MKEDAQLICPIGYEDKSDVWPTIQKFICDRLPLKDVTWKSPISSSFINIEKLPLRFLPASAKLFNETHHPYRRFLAPYVHLYLLCAESMDAYKSLKSSIKKWVEPYNNIKQGRLPWLIVYVPLGTSTMDVYQKIYSRLSSDFYTDKAGDHSVMLIIPPEPGSKRSASMSGGERLMQQSLFQQAYASLADLLGKMRDGVVASFQLRSLQYDADIRKLDSMRGTPTFDFWQLFLVKESLALMYQMLQLPDRALSLYEELEALLAFVPKQSLPASDWPMVLASNNASLDPKSTPSKSSSRPVAEGAGRSERGNNSSAEGDAAPASPNPHQTPGSSSSSSSSKPKKDLMTDACRSGEDIIAYSINQARMNILWNRFSLFQLQHYIFARQMYFLLVHLRQPTRCAEKALAYVRTSSASLEQQILRSADGAAADADRADDKLVQLRRAQADVWALTASLKLIRECRALLQLLVGGDSKFNSIFYPSSASSSSAGASASGSLSYSHSSSSGAASSTPGVVGGAHEAFQDNLAAISSASTHGSSMVYSSLAELSRSQHGIAHPAGHCKASMGGDLAAAISSPVSAASMNPAAALRDVLFSPQLDIAVELRDSSRVLGDLIEFALRRLQALSSSTVRDAGKRALDLALSTVPFSLEQFAAASSSDEGGCGSARRTVTKVGPGGALLTATSATSASTSAKNADLVVMIEQELSMLDESRENEGVAEVGDRMDQILLSISQKVRSTSHFWSKLYELSTPSHVLVSAGISTEGSSGGTAEDRSGSNGRGSRADSADSAPDSPVSSPFSSRVGTPIGSPMPGAGAVPAHSSSASGGGAVGGVAMRKMISRHSSRSLVMSRSQLERGKLLELCLSVLGCSAQWHLQLLANRPRFAIAAMLRCADLLMCNNQLLVAAKRLEEALQCGLLAPAAAYICSKGPGCSAVTANKRSIFQQCLAEEQLHQQQHLQHRAFNLATALHERIEYPLYGLWSPLWHWTLRKLLYCMQQSGQWEQYRTVIANLLVPTSADGVNRVPLQPESLLQDLLKEFIALSTPPPQKIGIGTVEADGAEALNMATEGLSLAAPATEPSLSKQTFPGLSVLRLPLGNYFDITLGMIRSAPSASAGADATDASGTYQPQLVRGFQVVREEWLPVQAMQCEGGRDSGYCLPVTLHSKLPGPVPVDSFVVVFKRFDADGIVHQMLQAGDNNIPSAECGGITANSQLSGEEFVCAPMALLQATEGDKPVLMLEPGTHSICMKFHPPTLGDYRLDRILLSVGTVLFESHLLPIISDTSHLYPHPYATTATATTGSLDATFTDEGTRNASVAASLAMEDVGGSGNHMEDAGGPRAFTAGEGRALVALRQYFRDHNIIQVLPPPNMLELCCALPPTVPVELEDDAYFTIRTFSTDELHNLTVKVCGKDAVAVAGGAESGSNSLTRSTAGDQGAALNALKQAHGRAASGFVAEENATPAARRVRRLDPLDDEEQQAMASATAAVASLLQAQQIRDRAGLARRSGAGAAAGSAVLSVAEAPHWAVFQSDISANNALDTSSLQSVNFEHVADGSTDTCSSIMRIARVTRDKRLHLRVPITVQADSCTKGGDAVLYIELSGVLMRGRCRIPVSITRELVVRAKQPIFMQAEPFLLGAANAGSERDVLLQARLQNNTQMPIELTGYSVSSAAQGSSGGTHSILDGPSELREGSGDGPAGAPLQVVVLQPEEEFPAGLLLRFPPANSAVTTTGVENSCFLEFSYQRNPAVMAREVHSNVYKHRTFTARRRIVLGNSAWEPAGEEEEQGCRTVVPAVDPLQLQCCVEVQPSAAVGPAPSSRSPAVAVLGKICHVSYKLTVRCPSSRIGQQFKSSSGAPCNDIDTTVGACDGSSALSSLAVSLCETAGWIVCGRSRRVLSSSSAPSNATFASTTPSSGSFEGTEGTLTTRHPECGWVEMTYELQWELVPVSLGVVPLPPIKVEYSWSERGAVESQLVYPGPLLANDTVLVLPGSSDGSASRVLTPLSVPLSAEPVRVALNVRSVTGYMEELQSSLVLV